MAPWTPDAREATREAEGALLAIARIGIVIYGVVHLVVAWLTGRIALGGGGEASSTGALREIAQEPFGAVLLWVIAVGMVAMALWQLAEAAFGETWREGDRWRSQVRHVGRAIVYGYLGWAALSIVPSAGGSGSGGGSQEESLTAMLLGAPAGQALVGAVGLGVVVVGVVQAKRGLDEEFTEKLSRAPDRVVTLGKAGYVAKGVTLALIGILFGFAAVTADPDRAGGMDQALSMLRDQPFGTVLLLLIALGLAAHGVFCFAWAKYPRP